MWYRRFLYPLAALILNCKPGPCYPEARLTSTTAYPEPNSLPDADIMDQLHHVEACLRPLRDHWLSDEEAAAAECFGRAAAVLELRSCLRVDIAPDWYTSACTGEEVFPCKTGPERCLEKGETPTQQCPCRCRGQIQGGTTIWITPNKKLLSASAVTLLTGCLSPWTPSLAPCSNIR